MAEFKDGPESLLFEGRPRWITNTITYNFMQGVPEAPLPGLFRNIIDESAKLFGKDLHDLHGRSFKAFDDKQEKAAEEALGLWSDVADIKFERREDTILRLADVLDLGLIETGAKAVGAWGVLAGALDAIVGKWLGFPLVNGADIRFGTDDQGEVSGGSTSPPPTNIWSKFNEVKLNIIDEIDQAIKPINTLIDAANTAAVPIINVPSVIFGGKPLVKTIPNIPKASELLLPFSLKLDTYGDLWINNKSSENSSDNIGSKGGYGFQTLVHEVGHALGLKHPGNYNASGGGAEGPYLPPDKDSMQYSIMSYDYAYDASGNLVKGNNGKPAGRRSEAFPRTPMLYDILAVQQLYGANYNTRNGDTRYVYSDSKNQVDEDGKPVPLDAANNPIPFMATIWDGGGYDTIDASDHRRKVVINLNPGTFSFVGPSLTKYVYSIKPEDEYNLAIAYGVTIEDAIGGSGDDILIGNGVDNKLVGGAGNDTLTGGLGADTLIGDEGVDTASYKGSGIGVLVSLATGKGMFGDAEGDILQTIENLEGSEKGDDVLIGDAGDNDLSGLGGKDTLSGNAGKDTLHGGAGNDSLYGDDGNDTLYGDGDDDLLVGGAGNDFIDGGDGFDTVSYENTVVAFEPPYGITVNIDETRGYQTPGSYIYSDPLSTTVIGFDTTLSAPIAAGTALDRLGNRDILRNLERIIGSSLDDVLIGNSKDNTIQGLAGNDIFIGNAGDNTLDGGDGIDTVSYRLAPKAVIVHLAQNIATNGFGGTDKLLNIEYVLGSDKDDYITGNIQVNWLFGGNGNDIVESGGGNDVVYGEGGNDSLYGEDGDDLLDGGLGNDSLNGGADNDVLFGKFGDDILFGEKGNDKLIGGIGADLLSGGDGIDTASYIDAIAGVVANLSNPQANTGDAQGDIYISIENLEGSPLNDVLFGNSQDNHLWGLGGDDYLDGLGGNDILKGGLGNDTYRIDSLTATIIEYFNQGIDTVNTSINYTLGAGTNLENLNLLEGTAAYNGFGNELSNVISGNSYTNYIDGGDNSDTLYGYAGGDTILGGNGDDWIVGGQGADILTGGAGNDMFVYNTITDAGDRITDFTVGSDKIKLTDVVNSSGWRSSNLFADGFLMTRQASSSMAALMIDPDGRGTAFRPAPFILFDNVSAAALGNMSNFVV